MVCSYRRRRTRGIRLAHLLLMVVLPLSSNSLLMADECRILTNIIHGYGSAAIQRYMKATGKMLLPEESASSLLLGLSLTHSTLTKSTSTALLAVENRDDQQLYDPSTSRELKHHQRRKVARSAHSVNTTRQVDREEEILLANEEEARHRRTGQLKKRLKKAVQRENRIAALESLASTADCDRGVKLTNSQQLELKGLLEARNTFEEQYDPMKFTKEHLKFKASHNDAFIALSRYCEKEWHRVDDDGRFDDDRSLPGDGVINNVKSQHGEPPAARDINVFFLDGPDGGTASALINRGDFHASQCFVANRHESSCNALKMLLPDANIVHATASEALTVAAAATAGSASPIDGRGGSGGNEEGAFANIDFAAYYFDGCGGFVAHMIGMLSAALLRTDKECFDDYSPWSKIKPIAVGYSLLGGNRDVVGKELAVSRALTIIARRRGMRLVHVLDDPVRYGIDPNIQKVGGSMGGTFTTWVLLQPDN